MGQSQCPPYPQVTVILSSTFVTYFCFVDHFICILVFLDSTYNEYHMILTFSLSMTVSRSIHIAADGIISIFFFLMAG